MEQITINNITVDIIRKDIKNIHLAVYPPAGRVRVALPISVNNDALRLFIISKLSWIKRRQKEFNNQERISPREFKQRESHYFLGKRYLLKIFEVNAPPKVIVKSRTYIELYVRPDSPFEKRREIITEWYRAELKALIQPLIDKWENNLRVSISDWQVKQMKTNWGSCKIEKQKIILNLELAKKPISCIEYVIVHEMIHLLERHHNERFLFLMDTHLPNWKQLRSELNNLPVSHADWDY